MLTTNCNIEELVKVSGIYYIINLITKKKYIGSSTNLYRRWINHSKKSSNFDLRCDIKLNGKENFIFVIKDTYDNISLPDLLLIEQEHLNQYYAQEYKNSNYADKRFRELLYNCLPDAKNTSAYKEWKKESKRQLSLNRTGNRNGNFGNRLTEDQKQRIKDGIKKIYENGYVNPNQGKKTSEQKKRNIIEGQKRAGKIREVYSLNLNSKEVVCHESMTKASKVTGIDIADIGRICHKKQNYSKGYYFSFISINDSENIVDEINVLLQKKRECLKQKYSVLNVEDNTTCVLFSLKEVALFCNCAISSIWKQTTKKRLLKGKYKISKHDS